MKDKAPNANLQHPENNQAPKAERLVLKLASWSLEFGASVSSKIFNP
jgi:hypothetical protein